jgi:hypothetical protein
MVKKPGEANSAQKRLRTAAASLKVVILLVDLLSRFVNYAPRLRQLRVQLSQ